MNRGLKNVELADLLQMCSEVQLATISPERFQALEDILVQDDQAIQIYIEYVGQAVCIRNLERKDTYSNASLLAEQSRARFLRTQKEQTLRTRRGLILVTGLLSIFVASLLSYSLSRQSYPEDQALIAAAPATVIDGKFARNRSAHLLFRQGEEVYLESGVVELAMAGGAVVRLEGPVSVSFVSDDRIRLISGLLSAQVSPIAAGFTVESPAGEFVDVGTQFCAFVTGDGRTECAVVQGAIEAIATPQPSADQMPRKATRVLAGSAIAVDENGFESIDYRPVIERINRMELALRGLVSASANLRILTEPPEAIGDAPGPLLLLEKTFVTTAAGDFVNYTQTGPIAPVEKNPPLERLESDLNVSSFLFFSRYVDDPNVQAEGNVQIRFSYPIVGIISSGSGLRDSQARFALHGTRYPLLEESERSGMEETDRITISDDRRSITINYTSHADHLRILLQSSP